MSTILRVKRRFDQEPLDALVIASKKRKIESGEPNEVITGIAHTEVLKFAGTINSQEDDVVEHLKKSFNKEELQANYKQHAVDITKKIRLKTEEESRASRYKVVKYFRSIDATSSKNEDESVMTVIDVEHSKPPDPEDAQTPVLDETEIGYVYDLYYSETKEDIFLDDELIIHPFDQDLVFDNDNANCSNLENDGLSEDSNSESHFRNDYPDSDHSDNSVDDDDIRAAVRRLKIGGESSDLSSEEDFVYAIDEKDVDTYGYKYAKYKAKMKKELAESDSDKETDDYMYAEDSNDEDGDKSEED